MSTPLAKPQFYTFDASVWSTAPRLAIVELNYPKDAFDVKETVLLEGQNFAPSFVKLNPAATLPTLVDIQGDVLDNTTKVVKYLIANAPNAPQSWEPASPEIIEALHEDTIDPNDLLLNYSRNDEERKGKAGDVPGAYWKGRQAALEKYAASSPPELKSFYEKKIAYNSFYNNIYHGSPDEATLKDYYGKAAALWKAVGSFLTGPLPKYLSERKGPYFGGEKPGEVDFHAIAWLARVVTAAGGSIEKLEEAIGSKLDPSVSAYYEDWTKRESFKTLGIF
ncbi:hypothetical protein BDY24DRAFT_389865 [Mrakia frigida]|uniref:glutathione S-transferase family protein n=1 Tax=Mrakia frigida TaxID=29902 RepID=UPI003FCC034A